MALLTIEQTIRSIRHVSEFNCGCPACAGGVDTSVNITTPGNGQGQGGTAGSGQGSAFFWGTGASVDRLAGTVAANGKPIWSPDQIAAHLNRTGGGFGTTGNRLEQRGGDSTVITFGFHEDQDSLERNGYVFTDPETGELTAFSEYFNFASFNAAQRTAARQAIGFWDDVVSVTFRETGADQGDINFGTLANAPQTQAYAYLPTASFGPGGSLAEYYGEQIAFLAADVWVSASQASNFQLAPGGYGLNTLTHEIGHAIGLSHPGSYNFGPGFAVTYANGAEYYQDARNYSIMSYWNPRDIGARDYNWNVMAIAYGATPMVHDILAVQKMYGADTTTRTGDTVYGFNSTAGKDVFDFRINEAPTVTIWDAGGNDTLDASGYRTDQEINLNPGSLSSIGGVTYAEALARLSFEQVNANRAELGYPPVSRATYDANMAALAANNALGRLTDNVGIAYGAIIENAVGGSGNDRLIGNAVANVLNGGAGIDVASYRDATAGVTASLATGRGTGGAAAGDRYIAIEGLEGSAFADTLTGSIGNDVLLGLAGHDVLDGGLGDDRIDGGEGNDTVRGRIGNDALLGGAGDDQMFGDDGNDTLDGGAGNDVLDGGTGNDVLDGGAGNDTLRGGTGDDTLAGGLGDDVLEGDNGRDRLDGGAGNDTLRGGADADVLLGGLGNDTLEGGIGDDLLDGGIGNDLLLGGVGRDTFRFTDLGGFDIVRDFQRGQDLIDLSGLDAVTGGARDAFAWIGSAGFGGTAGQLRAYAEGGQFFVAGDVNGDGVADFTIQTNVLINQSDVLFG